MIKDTAALWPPIHDALLRQDLEGHLAALIFRTGFRTATDAAAPWASMISDLLSTDVVARDAPRHISDVAMLGVRLALGSDATRAPEYRELARRELARAPLPPAACLRDDERLLLGVAAGIGAAAPDVAGELISVLRAREHTTSTGQVCIDLWAEVLATGARCLSPETAKRGYQQLKTRMTASNINTEHDQIAAFWLATRLLDASWNPTDEQLDHLAEIIHDSKRAIRAALLSGRVSPGLDAILLFDGLIASPADRFTRRSALDGILTAIDAFPKSATVLSSRSRSRPPFEIADEYDVQDLFHALVLPAVPDITPEDPAPKIAGHASRLDFTSKSTRIGFEIKHVKGKSHVPTIREELLLDERTYHEHPYVDCVVAFVWDPKTHIALHERVAFEADLSQTVTVADRTVRYVVRVR